MEWATAAFTSNPRASPHYDSYSFSVTNPVLPGNRPLNGETGDDNDGNFDDDCVKLSKTYVDLYSASS